MISEFQVHTFVGTLNSANNGEDGKRWPTLSSLGAGDIFQKISQILIWIAFHSKFHLSFWFISSTSVESSTVPNFAFQPVLT